MQTTPATVAPRLSAPRLDRRAGSLRRRARTLSIVGSCAFAVFAAAYVVVATTSIFAADVFSIGVAAYVGLAAAIPLVADQAYLVITAMAYSKGRADGGRSAITQFRAAISEVRPATGSWHRLLLAPSLLRSLEVLISPQLAVIAPFGALLATMALVIAALFGVTPSEGAILTIALLLLALAAAVSLSTRSALAAAWFGRTDRAGRRLVFLGLLPPSLPQGNVRIPTPRDVASRLVGIGGLIALLPAAIIVLLALLGTNGVGLGILVGIVLVHLATTTWNLRIGTRALSQATKARPAGWWRLHLAERTGFRLTFPRDTIAPTTRLLVDIVTPLGPASPVVELAGLLADHRALARCPARWTIVTEPGRVDEVHDYVVRMFDLHGCAPPQPRVRVLSSESTRAGAKRNLGAQAATAPYLQFTDADDRIDLARLTAALTTALATDGALQSVHLFPFYIQDANGVHLRKPEASPHSALTHHHCARLWPTAVFRSGLASYPDADFEDAILLVETDDRIDQRRHLGADTAFLTYADRDDSPVRLTRRPKDASTLLEGLMESARAEVGRAPVGDLSERERALVNVFLGRLAAELTWDTGSDIVEVLRVGLERFRTYRDARHGVVPVGAQPVLDQIAATRRRSSQVRTGDNERAVVSFLLDELSARSPLTTNLLAAADGAGSRASAQTLIALGIGLMNVDMPRLRTASERPTVLFNLDGEEFARARSCLDFFLRDSHFLLAPDAGIPPGDIEVSDPLEGTRHRLGSFRSDRLMSSRMLRLWDRCYPSLTEVERARAQIVLQGLRERLRPAIVRLVGTGPSSSAAVRTGTEGAGTVTICCNSWVRHPEAMTRMGAKIITAGDPIFHAGPSEYAREFRADATAWLRADPEHLLVTVSRDIGVYLAEFPVDVHDQITAVAFEPRLDPETFVPIESGRVQPFPNVLTLLMLPLAQLLRPAEVHLYGFDGGAQGAEEYWKYAAEANYSPELQQTVRDWHPEFFRLDYDEYRDAHSDHVALWLRHLADSGITARAGAPSNIPAIDAAFRTFVTPADTEGRTT